MDVYFDVWPVKTWLPHTNKSIKKTKTFIKNLNISYKQSTLENKKINAQNLRQYLTRIINVDDFNSKPKL